MMIGFCIFLSHCSLFEKNIKVKPGDFDYFSISKNYFQPPVNRPFPLTVQKGNNLYSSVTADGRYMYFTSDKKGNQDIYLRDLNSSVVVQITSHPASEFKPAVSPDGKKLAFVSTKFDPDGDLVLMDVNPEKTVKDSLKGIYPNEEFENFLTAKGGEDRFTDTDPVFTPDGKSILFVSDRFTPGLPNLVLLTLGKKEMIPLTKDGAASPRFSDDGRYILFISRKDDIHGEVYRYDRVSGVTERLTSDSYPDFSPSISPDGNYAFFVSIRKDSNGNGILDERDESVIVRKDLRSKKEKILSAPAVSAFDAKYSGFNGGSIVYSAPKFNAINIYFIPVTGSIAKQENIVEQFRYAERYRDDPEPENYRLALDSIDFYFSEDPLFPLYKSQYEYETVLKEISRKTRLEKTARLEEELYRKGDRLFGILIQCHLKKLQGKDCTKVLETASSEKNLADWKDKDTAPFVLSLAGQEAERVSNFQEAEKKYSEIIKKYPDYHQINSVREKIGELSMLKKGSGWLPEMFREILASGDSGFEDRKTVLNALEKSIRKNRNPEEKIALADSALKEKDWKKEVPYIHSILSHIKAEAQFELKKFKESNETADSYLPPLPPENPECLVNWQCVKPRACSAEDPFCLKGHLLKSKNFEGLGQVRPMFDELRIYLENYETSSGVVMDIKDMEKSFRYFENRANEFEIRDRLLEAALHHFYNTENMFLLKSRNLYVDSIYKKYAVYFQKKMVDSVLKLAKSQAEEEKTRLARLNPLGQENIDVIGRLSRFLVGVLDNRLTKNVKDSVDIRNLDNEQPLGKPGARDDALLLIEQHFNLSRPRARPILYHPALFGYAYYLINKNIAYDSHYRETKRMTAARKDKILESLKLAEYELKWIIFSEPTYSEAYQLLGWLYQYIDQSKSVRLKDSTRLEGEEFAESYEKYFPERHLEENIELYQQIIEFISDSENSKVLADLHLNLGNNYLLLNKFSEAEASYSKTEKFHRKISHSQRFEDYRQEALFFYNFGRTLLFAKKYGKAADYFVKAADIYSYNELYKKADMHKSEEKNPPEQKLAVLNAFIGLSNMEGGNFKEAVYYFKKSLALNLNRNYLDTMGLYNALSICYRNMGDFRLSSHFASESRKIYGKKSDFSLNFSSPSESFSRLIFTEDTTVNGKSRFPYGFKDEHQYLLSLGIEMGNQEDQNEFRRSAEIIEERKNFIEDKSLDRTFTGQLILKKDEWRDALHSICSDSSDEKLKTVLSVLSSVTDQEKFQRMKRLGYRIMKSVPEECRDRKEPLLRKTASLLVQFRNSEISVCRSKKNTLENCSDEFGRAYPEYDILLAYVFRQLSLEVKNPVLSLYYSGNSAELLEKAGGVSREVYYLPGDPLSKSARLHS
ncbi:MAG TPA: hypothetical protein PKV80_18930, partial [Leptospiraceae bacterium]|nr:hypothetical protein [Leptospiraceae bacterium]